MLTNANTDKAFVYLSKYLTGNRPRTSTYLISLNFVHQVFESWQAAQADHGLTLVRG